MAECRQIVEMFDLAETNETVYDDMIDLVADRRWCTSDGKASHKCEDTVNGKQNDVESVCYRGLISSIRRRSVTAARRRSWLAVLQEQEKVRKIRQPRDASAAELHEGNAMCIASAYRRVVHDRYNCQAVARLMGLNDQIDAFGRR